MNRLPLLLALVSLVSLADVPPADSIGCRDKSAGASCKRDDGTDGACVTSTCSRNDYSQGVPPKSVSYDCLVCGAAPAPAVSSPPAESTKKGSCAAVPGEALAVLALVLGARKRKA